jgi:hypothetical protein
MLLDLSEENFGGRERREARGWWGSGVVPPAERLLTRDAGNLN